jgi:PadR family transcriptional regulator
LIDQVVLRSGKQTQTEKMLSIGTSCVQLRKRLNAGSTFSHDAYLASVIGPFLEDSGRDIEFSMNLQAFRLAQGDQFDWKHLFRSILQHSISRQSMFNLELKKGSAELLVLSLLETRPRHGYEIGKLIEQKSEKRIQFHIGSLYPILCRLEHRGLIAGRWVEKAGERRRRYYRLTSEGRKSLATERSSWEEFVATINHLVSSEYA